MAKFGNVAAELRPFLLTGINSASGMGEASIAAWTRAGSYSVAVQPQAVHFELVPGTNNAPLAESFTCEIRRFSNAAFETICRTERETIPVKSLAWPSINAYYAAYYSAHAICRLFGRSISQLEAPVVASVAQVATLYLGASATPNAGLYSIECSNGQIEYFHSAGAGGSHEILWKCFVKLLEELSAKVLQNNPSVPEVQEVSGYLDELCARLKYRGMNGGNWLSSIRNDIQYRQLYGIWFPYSIKDSASAVVSRRLKSWLRETTYWNAPLARNSEIYAASDVAASITSLLYWLLRDLSARVVAPRHFVKSSTLSLLRQQSLEARSIVSS